MVRAAVVGDECFVVFGVVWMWVVLVGVFGFVIWGLLAWVGSSGGAAVGCVLPCGCVRSGEVLYCMYETEEDAFEQGKQFRPGRDPPSAS